MIRTIKLQMEVPGARAGEAGMATGSGGWLGKGVGFESRASETLPPGAGES